MWNFFSRDPSKDFAYEILDSIPSTEDFTIWRLHKGKKKANNEPVSIFCMDIKSNANDNQVELAKLAIKRLKTLRHPNVLTYIDSLETEKQIYLVTEYVEPLELSLKNLASNTSTEIKQKELFTTWGLFQITVQSLHFNSTQTELIRLLSQRALAFLHTDGNLQHNSVCMANILVNTAGEWKLGGLEYASAASSSSHPIPSDVLPCFTKYNPPERANPSKLSQNVSKWSTDIWGLGCLIWEIYNGPLKSPASLQKLGNIPKPLASVYCELVGANPSSRPSATEVVARCRKPGGYFHNDLIESLMFLEEIQIKEANDKTRFFNNLPQLLDNFPENLSRHKILPQLINAFDFGNAGSAVLTPMLKLGSLLSEEEYQKRIVPCVVKLFSSPDRTTRVRLLQQLEVFAKHLMSDTVNDQIFPHIANGFIDSNPVIREHTVKSILYLAPKLNYNNLNVEVLKHFARLQAKDDQGGIRTNTTVCLGKVASFLHPQIRQKVLVTAFTRALKDPFPPSRIAGILALAATQHYYLLNQIAQQVLPALCVLTCDPEREVRDQAFKVIKGFLGKLEKVSEDPSLQESMEAEVNSNSGSNMSDAASSWAGWAVSAVTSKFYKSQTSKADDSSTAGQVKSVPTTSNNVQNLGEMNEASFEERSRKSSVTSESSRNGNPMATQNDGWDVEEEWEDMDAVKKEVNTIQNQTRSFAHTIQEKTSNISSAGAFESESSWKTNIDGEKEGWGNDWNDTSNWNTGGDADIDKEEARKRREEKRVERQKEMEAKRNARQGKGGALKLGAKKLGQD